MNRSVLLPPEEPVELEEVEISRDTISLINKQEEVKSSSRQKLLFRIIDHGELSSFVNKIYKCSSIWYCI